MNSKAVWIGLGTAAVLLIAVVFFRVREVTLIEEVPEVATSSGSFAKSLEGSTPDGQLKADLGGDLVLSEALLERFDYYLDPRRKISGRDSS
ncbi:MAG: hypothetical protein IPH08_09420 [Rhodocyclaceae bacterium]|nr:hypothetical protein [Rhodocyclaceae bacterium]